MWDDDEFFKHQVSRATGTDIGGAWGAIGAQEHQNEKTRQEAFNQPRDLRTPKRSRPLETERPQLTKQQRAELRARAAAAEQRRKRFWHVIRSVIYFGVVSLCALIAIGIIGEQAPTTPDWITTLDCMAIGGAVAAMVLLYAAFNAKSYVQRFGVLVRSMLFHLIPFGIAVAYSAVRSGATDRASEIAHVLLWWTYGYLVVLLPAVLLVWLFTTRAK